MSKNQTLTPEQSKAVRELTTALTDFGRMSAFHGFADRHRAVGVKFFELEVMFPEAAKQAKDYFEAEMPWYDPEEAEGYQNALFNTLVSLRAFYDAEGFNRVSESYNNANNDIFDLATFSPDFDAERGCWKD